MEVDPPVGLPPDTQSPASSASSSSSSSTNGSTSSSRSHSGSAASLSPDSSTLASSTVYDPDGLDRPALPFSRHEHPAPREEHVRGDAAAAMDRDAKGKARALSPLAPARPPGADPATRSPSPASPPPTQPHVDIVSYPPASLLRLLASLLEQIAHANDALNLRSTAGPSTPGAERDAAETDAEAAFRQGRFDAAPLNSPVTPFARSGSAAHLASPSDSPFPVTPGADLLNQVPGGAGAGVQGFIPSLGGMHSPLPLARRRGSSFLKNKFPPSGSTPPASSSAFPPGPNPNTEPPLTSLLTASSVALASPTSSLCFHARNVPAISIEAYLLRILKYCPTTNEVFLSLLVYFDRMARISLEAKRMGLAKTGDGDERLFAIDSFNVHRLLIAGVTVASKFFSDVFYTNSRYAKVGGLPLTELNQLELQFLLLNDFRLMIPLDELQRYADQLLLFWVGRNPPPPPDLEPTPAAMAASTSSVDSASSSSSIPPPKRRPTSIRSQPSSSGTSVTSTITPGTPSTERASASEAEEDDDDPDDDDDDYDAHDRMDED